MQSQDVPVHALTYGSICTKPHTGAGACTPLHTRGLFPFLLFSSVMKRSGCLAGTRVP